MARVSHLGLLVLFAIAPLAAGCSDAPATVTGTVTVNGEVHQGLRVSFVPEAGGATATCVTDADGKFSVRTGQSVGLEVGEYRVTVNGYRETPSPTMTQQQVEALRIVPREHSSRKNTPHRASVKPGHNTVDITI